MFPERSGRFCLLVTVVAQIIFGLIPVKATAAPKDRILQTVNDAERTSLHGNIPPQMQTAVDAGKSKSSIPMERVKFVFKPSAEQRRELDILLAEQQDPSSPNFHRWLTPEGYADRFGLSRNDVAKVAAWLRSQGFSIAEIARSRTYIAFNGNSAQVEAALHTQIHYFLADGRWHFANVSEPSIPAAFAGSVSGISGLHNFGPKPKLTGIQPRVTSSISGNHFLQPGDFATIYNLTGLYNSGLDGTGQTIAVMGQTDLVTDTNGNFTDVAAFRANSGLSAPNLTSLLIPNTTDPGVVSGDIDEANLDVEWSGGVAKNAHILYVIGNGTTGQGPFDALEYTVSNKLAPVISISYGLCEPFLDSGAQQAITNAAMEANAQGQTIVAPSGDAGAADCDPGASSATHGLAVDFPGSMPYATSAGGSEFSGDGMGNPYPNCVPDQYWGCGTGAVNDTSATALAYIPETVWNDTYNDVFSAGGGGLSIVFPQPDWQSGLSAVTNGMRGVPDISFSASADHDGYLICSQGSCSCGFRNSCTVSGNLGSFDVVGGTSASAPSFAGIVALINQKMGTPQGNVNPALYTLGYTNPRPFHDIVQGNNLVPCTIGTTGCPPQSGGEIGYYAHGSYDLASGWGSVDAGAFVSAWTGQVLENLSVAQPSFGSITSTDGKIDCGNTCSAFYPPGTVVTLNAVPTSGFVLQAWGGACSGVSTGACTVTMSQAQSVTATFSHLSYPLTVSISGNGTVADFGYFTCPTVCSYTFVLSTFVILTPAPAPGWSFAGWTGCDWSASWGCALVINAPRTVAAKFVPPQTLSVSTTGSGTVTSLDRKINCGAACSHTYPSNSPVTLTPKPAPNWAFTRWNGCDRIQGTICTVSMYKTRSVTASFTQIYSLSVSTTGSGAVTSNGGGINCGSACSHGYLIYTPVTLTATPAQGWALTNWSGCDAVRGNVCTVGMYKTRAVSATFKPTYVVTVSAVGNGTVISGDGNIHCGAACSYSYPSGTALGLTAVPVVGSQLSNWSGCTSVNGSVCTVVVTTPIAVAATFSSTTVAFSSLTFSPSTVRYRQVAMGTLTLSAPAPTGGITIGLASSAPAIVTVPSVVFIPGGASSVKFGANAIAPRPGVVTITATDGNTSIAGNLAVVP